MNLKRSLSYKSKLLLWGTVVALIPVAGIILGGWLLPHYVTQELDQELVALQNREAASLTESLQEFFAALIRQKALDVAAQLDLYLAIHPHATLAELIADQEFRRLAVQPVGKTGVTLLLDSKTGANVIRDRQDSDGYSLKDGMALKRGWDELVQRQSEGGYAWGFYDELSPDGQWQRKFAFFAPLNRTTADKVRLTVGASAALAEMEPWAGAFTGGLAGHLNLCKATVGTRLAHLRNLMVSLLSGLAALAVGVSLFLARRLSRGMQELKAAARAMDEGHLDYRLPPLGRDEWGEVAERLNRMAARLQQTTVSRREWENTFDAIPELLFLVDANYRLRSLNRAAAEFLMMPPESVQGMSCQELARHLEPPPPFFVEAETWCTGHKTDWEWHDPISHRVFQISSHPLMEEGGNSQGAVFVARDITLLTQAQKELAQTSRFLHDILEAAPLAISVVDRKGFFTYLNPQVFREFGYTPQELVGQHYSLLYATEEERQKIVSELRERGEVQSRRVLLRHKDGSSCPARLSVRKIIDPQGEVMGSVALSRNCAEEEKLQRQLEQAQRLESIATMAGGLAHNFNNLLMIIMGLTRLILNQIEEDNPLQVELQEIIGQVQAGSELTRQLLALARETPFEVRPVNLHRLIRQVADVFARTHRDVQLNLDLMENPAPVAVDAGQIQQVLMNLLVNSWQAMPEGGVITLQTSLVTLTAGDGLPPGLTPGNYVRLDVKDTGVGMDEETLKHIFEPFFTTKTAGTGLGLPTAYTTIRQHQGFMEVKSQLGQGTVVTIHLPCSQQPPEESAQDEQPLVYGQGTILLVDDEPVLRKVAAKLLERLGYRVLTAPDGARALEIYKEKGQFIDLVILDVIMPGLNGYQTYNCLKALDPQVKVLFSSGYGESEAHQGIITTQGFIQKPYTVEALSQKVAAVLNS